MTHIVSVSVAGLAGRKDVLDFKLDRHLNVFFGLNGAGKTSLLKIMHSALRNEGQILQNVAFNWARVQIYTQAFNETFTTYLSKTPDAPGDDAAPEPQQLPLEDVRRVFIRPRRPRAVQKLVWKVEHGTESIRKTKGWHHSFLPTTRLYLSQLRFSAPYLFSGDDDDDGPSAMVSEETLERMFSESMKALWNAYTAQVLTAVRRAQEAGLANILKDILTSRVSSEDPVTELDTVTAKRRVEAFLERQKTPRLGDVLVDFETQFHKDPRLRRVVHDINAVETLIEEAMYPRNKLQDLLGALMSGGKTIKVSDTGLEVRLGNDAILDLNLLSSGEKHILRILVEALRVDVSSLLIDEPELSMHLDWQRNLIGYLQTLNPRIQLILATHSPEIMAEVPNELIHNL